MRGRDSRWRRALTRVLLFAMAIQGLTPDCVSLASSRLLRLVEAGAGPVSAPSPLRGDDDAATVEICQAVAAESAARVHPDDGRRPGLRSLPLGHPGRPRPGPPRWLPCTDLVGRWPAGPIPSPGRMRC